MPSIFFYIINQSLTQYFSESLGFKSCTGIVTTIYKPLSIRHFSSWVDFRITLVKSYPTSQTAPISNTLLTLTATMQLKQFWIYLYSHETSEMVLTSFGTRYIILHWNILTFSILSHVDLELWAPNSMKISLPSLTAPDYFIKRD